MATAQALAKKEKSLFKYMQLKTGQNIDPGGLSWISLYSSDIGLSECGCSPLTTKSIYEPLQLGVHTRTLPPLPPSHRAIPRPVRAHTAPSLPSCAPVDGKSKRQLTTISRGTYYLFPHRNVYSSQSYVSREQRRLCSGSAQARLTFGSGLLRFAHPYYAARRS